MPCSELSLLALAGSEPESGLEIIMITQGLHCTQPQNPKPSLHLSLLKAYRETAAAWSQTPFSRAATPSEKAECFNTAATTTATRSQDPPILQRNKIRAFPRP
eukprot:351938-Chlamydomonas_euryale.AAC.5